MFLRRCAQVALAISVVSGAACAGSDGSTVSDRVAPTTTTPQPSTDTRATPEAVEVTERRISVEDPDLGMLTFEALVAGDPDLAEQGRAVLFLHGFPQTAEAYREILPMVAEAGYYAVAFSQRGYSPDARPAEVESYRLVAVMGDLLGVADALGAEQFHLVGHDWGGGLAWLAARAEPERIASLTVLSTPHPDPFNAAIADPSDPQHEASTYMETLRQLDPSQTENGLISVAAAIGPAAEPMPLPFLELYAEALSAPGATQAAINWYRANRLPMEVQLGPIEVPTLFLWGADDPVFLRSSVEATAAYVRGPYTFIEVSGVGHWLPEEAGDVVAEALLAHLDSVGSAGT